MIKFGATLLAGKAIRGTARILGRVKPVTAQELNTQRKQSRGRIAKQLSLAAGVLPQRRLRKRVVLPRGAAAKPRKLEAGGLTLFDTLPLRWWKNGAPPAGTKKVTSKPDTVGRVQMGGAFTATMLSGFTGEFRRLTPQEWAPGKSRNPAPKGYLPIGHAEYVDLTGPGYRIRENVLQELALEFPPRWERRMERETRRAFK